jgi:hypothetical protein
MSRVRWMLLSGAGIVALGLVVFVGWTWRHPTAFEDYGGWGVGKRDVQVEETAYVGMTFPNAHASGSVTIHGADPHELADSTAATFAYFVCTPESGPAGAAIGIASESDFREECGDPVPADNATVSLAEQQLVVAVTPTREGALTFQGLDVHYTDGWQNGTQRVGGDVRIGPRQPR